MNEFHKENVVNLFWTGGWDSTFRLLLLILTEKNTVQPYYIIDLKRESFHAELLAMEDIRSNVISAYPYTEKLLLPTIYTKLREIKRDQVITSAYQKANKKTHFGSQYEWLAKFCKQNDIFDMEICVQGNANSDDARFLPLLEREGNNQVHIINHQYVNSPEYTLFEYFRFPIIKYSKIDIYEITKKNGWENIMNKTWFCHHPKPGNVPCGKCVPCQEVVSEYLGFRIPSSSELRSRLQDTKTFILFRRINNFLKNVMSINIFTRKHISKHTTNSRNGQPF